MATYTTVSKQKLSWVGTNPEPVATEAFELKISDDYKLNIGSGFNLTISPAGADIFWATTGKSKGHMWPAEQTVTTNRLLDIGDGYGLNIGNGYNLVIGPPRGDTPWTKISRNKFTF